jgi:hypothetical protein
VVATATVYEANGGTTFATCTPTALPAGAGRYKCNDTFAINANDPCVVPAVGPAWSWWKTHYLKFTGSGFTINNIRWYVVGGPIGGLTGAWLLGTVGKIGVGQTTSGDNGLPLTVAAHGGDYYNVASGTTATGASMDVSHTYYKSGGIVGALYKSAFTGTGADAYVSATPLTVDTNTYTTTGDITKAVVTQIQIGNDATQGTKAAITLTWRYSEV